MAEKISTLLFLLFSISCLQTKAAEEFIRSRQLDNPWMERHIDIQHPQNKSVIIIGSTIVDIRKLDSLAYAVVNNDPQRVAILLQRGRFSRGIAGLTLRQYAEINGYREVCIVLEEFEKSKIDASSEKKYSRRDT